MTCELWREQIEPYIDGELASSHEVEIATHLRGCPDCNAFAAQAIHLKRGVANGGRRYQPSQEFREKIMDSIGVSTASRRRTTWWTFALAAAAVIVVTGLVFLSRTGGADANREIADIHLSTLASANPVDVISTDMHTVKPWFQGRVPFTFNLPELSNSPFSLVGGRVVYLHDTSCALLVFQYRLHRISMVIGPANALTSAGDRQLPNGFHLVHFEKNGYTYATIGDAGVETLGDLAHRMESAQN
jgi:anti-sigma factor RsiW